jgi:hypothetical protein
MMFESLSNFYRSEIQFKSGIRIRQTKEAILGLGGLFFVAASASQLADAPKYIDYGITTYQYAHKSGEAVSFADLIHPQVRNDLVATGFYAAVSALFGFAIYDSRRSRADVYRQKFVDNWEGMEPWNQVNRLDMIRTTITDNPVCTEHRAELVKTAIPYNVKLNPYDISKN